jgi:hypothetical protein
LLIIEGSEERRGAFIEREAFGFGDIDREVVSVTVSFELTQHHLKILCTWC